MANHFAHDALSSPATVVKRRTYWDLDKAVHDFVRLAGQPGGARKAAARKALRLNLYRWWRVRDCAREAGLVEFHGWGRTARYTQR